MVKNRVFILIVSCVLLVLSACGSEDVETREFEIEEDGVVSTMTFYHQGDEVVKQTTENILPYENINVDSKEEAKALLDSEVEKMQGVEGVSDDINYGDSEATETLEIDYEHIDADKAKELPGMTFDGDIEEGISMEKSAELLLEQGYQEK